RAIWQYATHLLTDLGSNDCASGTSLANMQAYAVAIWQGAKRIIGPYGKPLQVAHSLMMPRTTSNQELASLPTIAAGGTGYAANSTFTVTLAGGTVASGGNTAQVSVSTDGSGVVTTVNSIVRPGLYSAAPASPNTPTGGTGSGLQLTCAFGGWFNA